MTDLAITVNPADLTSILKHEVFETKLPMIWNGEQLGLRARLSKDDDFILVNAMQGNKRIGVAHAVEITADPKKLILEVNELCDRLTARLAEQF